MPELPGGTADAKGKQTVAELRQELAEMRRRTWKQTRDTWIVFALVLLLPLSAYVSERRTAHTLRERMRVDSREYEETSAARGRILYDVCERFETFISRSGADPAEYLPAECHWALNPTRAPDPYEE